METLLVTSTVILLYIQSDCITCCELLHTKPSFYDFRCEASSNTDVAWYRSAPPQCVWRCLRKKTCRYVNHNPSTKECQIGLGHCEFLRADVGFVATVYGQNQHDCLRWSSFEETGRVRVQGENPILCVARMISENTFLLGKLNFRAGIFRANNGGVSVGPIDDTDQEIDILTKDETCSVPWMAYTAGQTLPAGAVTGGHLADGSITYVAKIIHGSAESFGYYTPTTSLAYYEFKGIHTATSMDILVLI